MGKYCSQSDPAHLQNHLIGSFSLTIQRLYYGLVLKDYGHNISKSVPFIFFNARQNAPVDFVSRSESIGSVGARWLPTGCKMGIVGLIPTISIRSDRCDVIIGRRHSSSWDFITPPSSGIDGIRVKSNSLWTVIECKSDFQANRMGSSRQAKGEKNGIVHRQYFAFCVKIISEPRTQVCMVASHDKSALANWGIIGWLGLV